MPQQQALNFISRHSRFLLIFVIGLFLSVGFVALPKMSLAAGHCSESIQCSNSGACGVGDTTCRSFSARLAESVACTSGANCTAPADAACTAQTPAGHIAGARASNFSCVDDATGAPIVTTPAAATPPVDPAAAAAATSTRVSTSDACGPSGFMSYVCQGITFILGAIVELLGKLIMLILSVLLAFAKYNGFASAAPVETGWPIVRDVCNMFFIVILLISAFSTIIDYGGGELHYSKVLPRLLLMAVLINFSKTLIQLLIDFSQVIMLTFVNAFASAAQGNFVNALGLTKIMDMSPGVAPGAATGVNIIIAYMLAIFMLGIIISVVTIMTGFLIFRIVGLWIALILSPLALFVTAIPNKLSKSFAGVAGEYWSRLGALLSGGPIMAFFLWLTLAVVQGANQGGAAGGGMSKVLGFEIDGGGDVTSFLTSIGDTQSIASFIVGIALLMMGLEQAVKISGQINPMLGKFAEKAKGAGMSIGRLGALAPFLAAGYGARQAGRGAVAGVRFADKRGQYSQRLATVVAGSKAGQFLTRMPVVGEQARKALGKGMQGYEKEIEAGAKERMAYQTETLKRLPPGQRDAYVKSMLSQTPGSPEGKKSFQQFSDYVRSDDYRKAYEKRNESKYAAELEGKDGMTADDAKNASKVLVQQDAVEQERQAFQKDLGFARSRNDHPREEQLLKELKLKPYLANTESDRKQVAADLAKDADKYKDISEADASSGLVLTEMMKAHGWKVDATSGALELKDAAAYDRLKSSVKRSGNKKLGSMLGAHESFVLASPGITETRASRMQHRVNPGDNSVQAYSLDSDPAKRGTRVRNDNQAKAFTQLSTAGASRRAGESIDVPQAHAFIDNGGRLSELMNITKNESDGTPIADIASDLGAQVTEAGQKFDSGDREGALQSLKFVSKLGSQIDDKGVTEKVQIQIISKFGGDGGSRIISNYQNLGADAKASMAKIIEAAIGRADDIRRNVAPADLAKSKEMQLVLKFADKAVAEALKKDSNMPSYIRELARNRGVENPA